MTKWRRAQSTQIHASEVYTLCEAVHGFAHITHGTYYCTASCKFGSVQSARDMNLSLTVKAPTEISLSPDTISSVMSVPISNCDILVEKINGGKD